MHLNVSIQIESYSYFYKRRYNVYFISIFNLKDVHKLQLFRYSYLYLLYSTKKNTENMNLNEEQNDWTLIAAICSTPIVVVLVIGIILYIRKRSKL